MGKDMDWGWNKGDAGFTGANGPRDSRADTECDNQVQATQDTKAPGRTDFKTDMDLKHMPTAVSFLLLTLTSAI